MQHLLLSDLRLALPELLDNKLDTLHSTHAGSLYAPRLSQKREAIDALPDRLVREGRPLADQLAQTDAEHDGFGAAIWHYTEALRLVPDLPDELREAAENIRTAFIPTLALLRQSYASEAAHALDTRERLTQFEAELSMFPVPGSDDTLRDWTEAFIRRGETLEALLRARAEHTASTAIEGTRKRATALRIETIALLGRLRTALADELAGDPQVHAAMDAELFSYFDQLIDTRTSNFTRTAAANTIPPAATPATSTPATGT